MRFGPFNKNEVPQILAVLKERGIASTQFEDQELLAALTQEFRDKDFLALEGRGPSFQPAYIYIDFEEVHLSTLGNRLENFGITTQSFDEPDFEGDDYYCPQCGFHSVEPGFCAKHSQSALIPSAEYRKREEAETNRSMQTTWSLVLIAIGALVLFQLYRMFS